MAFRATWTPVWRAADRAIPARYDDTVSAQPAEREDPLDPQRILDQLPADERRFFLDQYREAVENARDRPAGSSCGASCALSNSFHSSEDLQTRHQLPASRPAGHLPAAG